MQVYKAVDGGEGNWAQKSGSEVQTGFPILLESTKVVPPVFRFFAQKIEPILLKSIMLDWKSFVLNNLNKKLGNDSCEEIQFLEPNGPENV